MAFKARKPGGTPYYSRSSAKTPPTASGGPDGPSVEKIDNRTAAWEDFWRVNEKALNAWYEGFDMHEPPPACWIERRGPWTPPT